MLLITLATGILEAQTRTWTDREALVKSAMLLNFARYTYYPNKDDSGILKICVIGKNPFGNAIYKIAGKKVGNKKAEILVATNISDALLDCKVLFISSDLAPETGRIIELLQDSPVLTVAEMPDFLQRGGMINLINLGSTTRFKVSRSNLQNNALGMSAQVLSLAITTD